MAEKNIVKKKTLLYVSPFPPEESGISDYSECLVGYLDKYFDITLFIDGYRLSNSSMYERYHVVTTRDEMDPDSYAYRLYNIGNNPEFHSYIYRMAIEHPGTIILHDFSLYYLFTGYHQSQNDFYSALYRHEGKSVFLKFKDIIKEKGDNLLEQKENASVFAMNRELLSSRNKIMVHSSYAYDKVKNITDNLIKINMIPQIPMGEVLVKKSDLFKKYGIPEDSFVFASFGMIASTKLNREICSVMSNIIHETQNTKLVYVMVGQGDYADSFLDQNSIYKTGFTTIEEFDSFIEYADVVINLRNPTMGETSAAMLRILQKGKACITNNGGWFSELPDDCVIKVDLDSLESDLKMKILKLIENNDYKKELENRAFEFFEKEYNSSTIVQKIYNYVVDE